jgi:hypothetical protein
VWEEDDSGPRNSNIKIRLRVLSRTRIHQLERAHLLWWDLESDRVSETVLRVRGDM